MVGGRCLFLECRKRSPSRSGRGITFHGFPRVPSQFVLWENWVREACGMTDFKYFPSTSVLCSRHFPEKSFIYSGKSHRLRKNTVPSITPDDLNAAETLGVSLNAASCHKEAERSRLPAMTEDATSPPLNSLGETDKADKSRALQKASLGKQDDSPRVSVEAQDDGGGPSNLTSRPQTEQKINLSLDDQRAEKHLHILRKALTTTRNRLGAQSGRILRVKKSVFRIHRLVRNLRDEQLILERGQSELDIAVSNILDHLKYK